jgi:hypothetical protein
VYKPGAGPADILHFRPLDIDIWYPVQEQQGADSVLRFGDLLGLLEQRANFYSAPKTFGGLTGDLAKSFCEAYGCSQSEALLGYRTSSRPNVGVLPARFPLILYMTSYNGMSYENFTLFESLVRQGYTVVSVNSIGQYPGDMTMETADLMEQVWDGAFVLDRMKGMPYIDSTRVGLIGYSWGGLAGAVLAMQQPGIKAVVSFDGSEFHHYGQSGEEDRDFEATVNSPFFKNATLTAPYLRLESGSRTDGKKKDSVYHFLAKVQGEKQVFQVVKASHQDFSCLPRVVKTSGNCQMDSIHPTITDLTLRFLDKHLKQ